MFYFLVFSLALVVVSSKKITDFKDCGSISGKIDSLDVTPCAEFPCQFPKGKNVSVSIGITANAKVTAAKTLVHGIIGNLPVPFPIDDPDACTDMACPVNSGAEVTYNNTIFVQEIFPHIRLVVKWEIQDQSGKDLICFELPVEIVD